MSRPKRSDLAAAACKMPMVELLSKKFAPCLLPKLGQGKARAFLERGVQGFAERRKKPEMTVSQFLCSVRSLEQPLERERGFTPASVELLGELLRRVDLDLPKRKPSVRLSAAAGRVLALLKPRRKRTSARDRAKKRPGRPRVASKAAAS